MLYMILDWYFVEIPACQSIIPFQGGRTPPQEGPHWISENSNVEFQNKAPPKIRFSFVKYFLFEIKRFWRIPNCQSIIPLQGGSTLPRSGIMDWQSGISTRYQSKIKYNITTKCQFFNFLKFSEKLLNTAIIKSKHIKPCGKLKYKHKNVSNCM